jgi:hypothetical protein
LSAVLRAEPNLPLEIDKDAPPSKNKMSRPSLADLGYVLSNWQKTWNMQRDLAWLACATTSERGEVGTPEAGDGSLGVSMDARVVERRVMMKPALDTMLYGFPLEQSLQIELYKLTSQQKIA